MNWEEYQNSDWYRESHPDWNSRPSRQEQEFDLMRGCVEDIEEYEESIRKNPYIDFNGDVYESDEYEVVDGELYHVVYICATTWNGRINGLSTYGSYRDCRVAVYRYDMAHLNSEWQWACVKKITYKDNDELEEILNGYRELEYEPYYDDYDYDY